ncbi:Arginyl-tRNA synthetase [Lunasporangiospora selenospora]|uniref:arginine--tRNA ligase n=1 Tax=Lunasporangiospora selenospora TaxID=979761 RepID=A0A9P6KFI6_9FUNG|nr:Arginyl-tRNA synthetase [Lunasporangiospora selenospora]
MASTRFRNVIASQLSKITGGDVETIFKAIDRPKLKGHGTFAIPLPRLLPNVPRPTSGTKETVAVVKELEKKVKLDRTTAERSTASQENRTKLLERIQQEFDTSGPIRSVTPLGQFINFSVDEPRFLRESIQDVVQAQKTKATFLSQIMKEQESSPSASLATAELQRIEGLGYGMDSSLGRNKVIALDYSSPNIAKPFHGGHLRGTILGNFVTRLLRGHGYQVIGINYLGDWGKQYGLMAVGFDRYGDRKKLQEDPIKHLFDVYVKINKDVTENPPLDKLANQYFKQMEEGDPSVLNLWREFRSLSIEFYRIMYKRLGIEFDVYSGESESAQWVPQAYQLLREKGLLKEQEDGAWVVDLTEHGLGVCALRRADGTTLYLTRDVAACLQRTELYKFDRHLYMIGDDQTLHLKRLFKIMELAFANEATAAENSAQHWSRSLQHVSFGKVQGMSTRRGNAVFLEDILDTAQSTMLEKMKENDSKFEAVREQYLSTDNNSQPQEQQEGDVKGVEQVADKLGISAVVIQDFQARSSKGYDFSWKRMTDSTGNTGIYLQYAHARLCGIESRSGIALNTEASTDFLTEPEAFELANMISIYPEITLSTLQTLEPSMIVNYLFGLSHAISSANQVLQVKSAAEAGQKEKAEARLLLLWAARITLGNGMRLLGLDPLERM